MLIQISIFIWDMVLDLILDHFFYIQVLVEGKNVTIFGVDYSSSVDTDNNEKDITVLVESPTQGLDDTTIAAEILLEILILDISLIFQDQIKKFV